VTPAPQRFSAQELRQHLQDVKEIAIALNRMGADKHFVQAKRARAQRGRPGSGIRPAPPGPVTARSGMGPAPRLRSLATGSVPANVKVNNSTGDTFHATQSEESVAALGDYVVAAWNDGQGSSMGGAYQGYSWSNDGGQTWTDGGDPPKHPSYPSFRWMSDPVLTVNEKTGTFYYCAMANTDATHNALALVRGSFTGGVFSWQDVRIVREVTNSTAYLDKLWITADSSGAGTSVYLTYTTFTVAGNHIDLQRSTDGGLTWSAAQRLSNNGDNGQVQASRPAVGPGGELYVLWFAIGQSTAEDFLRLRKSTNGGQNFGSEVTVADYIANFGTGSPGFNRERGIHFPSIAVDRTNGPYRGRAYVVWSEAYNFQDDPFGTTGVSRVEVESNNFAAAGTPFTPGDLLRGNTASSSPADQDYWTFDLAAGQSIVVYADSLPPTQTYALRIFGGGGDTAQSLCFGGDFTPGTGVSKAYYTFTAPVTSSYHLRMGPIDASSVPGGYRVRTGPGVRASERGRDQRDVFVSLSDGGSGWSAPLRVNDDVVGLDNYLPEIGVGADGCPYVMWADHRDEPYGATTHRYLSRSTDGGATWAANQRATSVASNWYYTFSNLAPNMGDYSAIGAGSRWLHLAWADGRDGSADVYGARVDLSLALPSCAPAVSASPGATLDLAWTIGNGNALFANNVTASLSTSRGWPLPSAATAPIGAEGAHEFHFNVQVPDTASPGEVTVVMVASPQPGALPLSCATTITVTGPLSAGGPSPTSLWLAPSVPNPARGAAALSFALPTATRAALRIYGLRGESVRTLLDGELGPGIHHARWDGRDDRGGTVPAGTYFYRLETPRGTLTQRLAWLR
jgi:hypothetical protein